MAARLESLGYDDYRRTDALVLRALRRGVLTVGQLAVALEVSRQAARKVAEGLERRGYATTVRDAVDARRRNVELTPAGVAYADAVVRVVRSLNAEFAARVEPDQLDAAREVLEAVLSMGART
jgi:DNA-binding MarR family transcriptional regulator